MLTWTYVTSSLRPNLVEWCIGFTAKCGSGQKNFGNKCHSGKPTEEI